VGGGFWPFLQDRGSEGLLGALFAPASNFRVYGNTLGHS
jgi:hypothetical protein